MLRASPPKELVRCCSEPEESSAASARFTSSRTTWPSGSDRCVLRELPMLDERFCVVSDRPEFSKPCSEKYLSTVDIKTRWSDEFRADSRDSRIRHAGSIFAQRSFAVGRLAESLACSTSARVAVLSKLIVV